jgi:hypothetical protein
MWDGWAGSLQSTFRSPDPDDLPPLIEPEDLLEVIDCGACPAGPLAAAAMAVYGPAHVRQQARLLTQRLVSDGAVLPPSLSQLGMVKPVEALLLGDVWGDDHVLVLDCERADGTLEGSKVTITNADGVRAVHFVHGPTIAMCRSEAFQSDFAVATKVDLADARALFELASTNYDPFASPAPSPFLRPESAPLARFGSGPVEVSLQSMDPPPSEPSGPPNGNGTNPRPPVRRPRPDPAETASEDSTVADGDGGGGAGDAAGDDTEGPSSLSAEELVLSALGDADDRDRLHLTVEIAEADRAIVEHRFGLLPGGGESPLPRFVETEELHPDLLTVEFAASGWPTTAMGPAETQTALTIGEFVEVACRFSTLFDGDPLRWSPERIRRFLVAELYIHGRFSDRSRAVPHLLRAWLGFAADRRGVPPRALAVSQMAVDTTVKEIRERQPRR